VKPSGVGTWLQPSSQDLRPPGLATPGLVCEAPWQVRERVRVTGTLTLQRVPAPPRGLLGRLVGSDVRCQLSPSVRSRERGALCELGRDVRQLCSCGVRCGAACGRLRRTAAGRRLGRAALGPGTVHVHCSHAASARAASAWCAPTLSVRNLYVDIYM